MTLVYIIVGIIVALTMTYAANSAQRRRVKRIEIRRDNIEWRQENGIFKRLRRRWRRRNDL